MPVTVGEVDVAVESSGAPASGSREAGAGGAMPPEPDEQRARLRLAQRLIERDSARTSAEGFDD